MRTSRTRFPNQNVASIEPATTAAVIRKTLRTTRSLTAIDGDSVRLSTGCQQLILRAADLRKDPRLDRVSPYQMRPFGRARLAHSIPAHAQIGREPRQPFGS